MTRRFIDEIRTAIAANQAFIAANIFSNSTGLISGNDVAFPLNEQAALMTDMCDSLIDDEALLQGTTTETFTIDENWVNLSDALLVPPAEMYETTVGGDEDFLIVTQPAGTIQGTSVVGYTYSARGALGVDAANTIVIEAAIGLDGVPNLNFVGSIVGTGGVREQSMYVEKYSLTTPANAVFSLMVRAPAGSTSITVTPRTLALLIKPTNNP